MKRREAREQAFILAFEQTMNQESIRHIIDAAGMSWMRSSAVISVAGR